jgi:hypothetical protein
VQGDKPPADRSAIWLDQSPILLILFGPAGRTEKLLTLLAEHGFVLSSRRFDNGRRWTVRAGHGTLPVGNVVRRSLCNRI